MKLQTTKVQIWKEYPSSRYITGRMEWGDVYQLTPAELREFAERAMLKLARILSAEECRGFDDYIPQAIKELFKEMEKE